jgi:hypothetical protein
MRVGCQEHRGRTDQVLGCGDPLSPLLSSIDVGRSLRG